MKKANAIYACRNGHRSNITRFPNDEGVRRCFFCGEVAHEERS